jgi:hypothetical protein
MSECGREVFDEHFAKLYPLPPGPSQEVLALGFHIAYLCAVSAHHFNFFAYHLSHGTCGLPENRILQNSSLPVSWVGAEQLEPLGS